jgi:hypothetical protein
LNKLPQFKTGNAFVTESFPKYTIFCFFTACSGEKINEVVANGSGTYAVLPVLTFLVQSLETEHIPKFAGNRIFPTRQRKTTEDTLF